jgi:two-component system response regulator FixJ
MSFSTLPDGSSHSKAPVAVAVVDDDAAVLESLRFLLEVSGYRVATFGSAADFLADGGRDARYLIIDHHMPQMTGLDLIEQLVATPPKRHILLITGSCTPAIRARAATLGVAKVLEKPPAEDELLTFLEGHRGE